MMNDGLKASGPSRQRAQYTGAKPFGKNAAAAKNGITPEAANRHSQDHPPASDRKIACLPQISALGAA
jgi:hypothetical protein